MTHLIEAVARSIVSHSLERNEGDETISMSRIGLESKVLGFIRRHKLISPGAIVVVGVSGGADSVCLLHLLARWRSEFDMKLHIAHLDHQLRGAESQVDAKYVSDLASQLGIPITIDSQDVAAYRSKKNCSLEEAARELRYSFLATVASDVGADRVAIGHTRDDQVETILMHILRGTGISGLRGLEPCSPMVYSREKVSLRAEALSRSSERSEEIAKGQRSNLLVIRPLLDITRRETMNYCQEYGLEPRVDSSNLSLSFLRNRLRLELLPLLKKYNPSVDQALLRLAEIVGEDDSFIQQQALHLWNEATRLEDNAIYLDKKALSTLSIALQRRIIRLAAARVLGDTRDIEASHIEAMRSLLSKSVGKRISLPHGLICQSEYDEVVIATSAEQPHVPRWIRGGVGWASLPLWQGEFLLKVPGETTLPGWRVLATTAQERIASPPLRDAKQRSNLIAEFDFDKTGAELFVRQRRPGDRFQPLGMNTPKKLQEFMIDAKIPLSWRERIPIVYSPRQIVWVVGWRIDDRVKVTEAIKEILSLEFIRSS